MMSAMGLVMFGPSGLGGGLAGVLASVLPLAGGEAGEAFGAEAALLFLGGGDFAGGVLDGLALGFDFLFCLALGQALLAGVPGGFALFLALLDLGVVEGGTGFEFLEQGGAGFFGGFATLGEVGGEA